MSRGGVATTPPLRKTRVNVSYFSSPDINLQVLVLFSFQYRSIFSKWQQNSILVKNKFYISVFPHLLTPSHWLLLLFQEEKETFFQCRFFETLWHNYWSIIVLKINKYLFLLTSKCLFIIPFAIACVAHHQSPNKSNVKSGTNWIWDNRT